SNTKEHQDDLKKWQIDGEDPTKLNLQEEAKVLTADLKRSKRLVAEGKQLTKAGKYTEAVAAFKAAIGASSQSAAAHSGLIHAYAVLQDHDNLHEAFRQAAPFFKSEMGNTPIDEWLNTSTEKLLK